MLTSRGDAVSGDPTSHDGRPGALTTPVRRSCRPSAQLPQDIGGVRERLAGVRLVDGPLHGTAVLRLLRATRGIRDRERALDGRVIAGTCGAIDRALGQCP